MLIVGIAVDYFDAIPQFQGWVRVAWYTIAYIPVGFPVIKEGLEKFGFVAMFLPNSSLCR